MKNKPEVVWEQTNTCEKEHKELSWQKSRIFLFFLPHVKDRTFWNVVNGISHVKFNNFLTSQFRPDRAEIWSIVR